MVVDGNNRGGTNCSIVGSKELREEDNLDLRRGPWTFEEDLKLMDYITHHGEGRWNSLARCAGLNRTGKSCRLRWLNYLRPDVRRGNLSLEEQLMILELHSRWGNRWSKIAQHLPGRTDNEIKNYWRTRVQKQAKQLKCDVNSKQFKDTMRYLWMPRLIERIQATSAPAAPTASSLIATASHVSLPFEDARMMTSTTYTPENSSTPATSFDSFATSTQVSSDLGVEYNYNNIPVNHNLNPDYYQVNQDGNYQDIAVSTPSGYYGNQGLNFQENNNINPWLNSGDTSDILWNMEDIWISQQQLNSM